MVQHIRKILIMSIIVTYVEFLQRVTFPYYYDYNLSKNCHQTEVLITKQVYDRAVGSKLFEENPSVRQKSLRWLVNDLLKSS